MLFSRPVTFCKAMRSFSPAAYTLVELLVALALSLLLLLGVIELLSRVGGTMNDTRAAMSASANLHETALLLRQDLAQIDPALATKPTRIINPEEDVSDSDGYLEIIEGPDTVFPNSFNPLLDPLPNPLPHPYVDDKGKPDVTVGDVDDIIAFTALSSRFLGLSTDFRGLIRNEEENGELRIEEREAAEIVWFVRGNTLYRRVRLINDATDSVSGRACRENRLLHWFAESNSTDTTTTQFPFPLYVPDSGWRYLRVPTLEETINVHWIGHWKTMDCVPKAPTVDNPDLWEQPYFFPNLQDRKSGSLKEFVQDPRHVRAGEDVVLTNVLSFDVKVWCPKTKNFVDLGTPDTTWDETENKQHDGLPRTWDSWTQKYKKQDETIELPPFAASLEAIQITIRCFDPASRAVKQVTVVHRFRPAN